MEEQKTSRNSGAPESESENMHEEVRAPRQAVPDGEAERGGAVSDEVEERESFRFRPHCGRELPVRGTDFCAFCGGSIRRSDPDQPARTVSLRDPSAEQSAVVRWILPICALSMIALIIGYLFGNFFSMSASLGEGLELDDAIKINGIELIRLAFELLSAGASSGMTEAESGIYSFAVFALLLYIVIIILSVVVVINALLSKGKVKASFLQRNKRLMIAVSLVSLSIFGLYLISKGQITELTTGMSGGLTDEFISYSSITGWLFGLSLILTGIAVYIYHNSYFRGINHSPAEAVIYPAQEILNISRIRNDVLCQVDESALYWKSIIVIPNSIKMILEILPNCRRLVGIRFESDSKLERIGSNAFWECKNLESIDEIPSSIQSIGANVFCGCNKLEAVVFKKNSRLTTIGKNAFTGCNKLRQIKIPRNVEIIGEDAFASCFELKFVEIEKDAKLLLIEEGAFSNCQELQRFFIPINVKKVGAFAFSNCNNLTIYCEAKSQPAGWHPNWNPQNRPVVWGCCPPEQKEQDGKNL